MTYHRTRQITVSVSLALAAMVSALPAGATATKPTVALESVRMLDPARANPGYDTASIISADRIEGNPEERLHLYGDAEIRRGGAVLRGDHITYTQATDEVEAQGNAKISRLGASFTGPSMRFRISERAGEMPEADYEYAPRNIRGCAKNIRFLSGEHTTLEDAKITTCKRDDEAWFIKLNKLEIDEYDNTATGTGAVLHFLGIPVLGSPWFSFPVSNDRRSGFLVPSFGVSSTRGVDVIAPYYFNLAPNYDLTLSPRVMSKRGAMLQTESRFLYNNFDATVNYDYLAHDRVTGGRRYGMHTQVNYSYDKFQAHIDYNRVSDNEYISDFSGNIRESSESILPQSYDMSYNEKFWRASVNVLKNQTLRIKGVNYYQPYERVPQLKLDGYVGDWHGFELTSNLEATRFKNNTRVEGDRFVFQQTVSYPVRGAGWFVIPKARYLGTWYQLDNYKEFAHQGYNKKNPSRTLPMFSLDSGLVFERDTTWFGRDSFQTLEPRLYYAWVPYRNQDNLPVFDSSVADLNFATLFSENIFSGYDRISEANQLTAALTTRYVDKASGMELFRASIGQRQYFADQRVGFPKLDADEGRYVSNTLRTDVRSDLLASVGARLTRSLVADANTQYSSAQSRFVKTNIGLRWQPKPMSVIGLYYRYNYAGSQNVSRYYDDNIKQLDLQIQWPITHRLYALARYNYSLYTRKAIEIIGGFEYVHDCWTLRAAAQRYTTATSTQETNFFLQLELNGLGSIGTSPLSELKRNIRGYQAAGMVPDTIGQYDYYE